MVFRVILFLSLLCSFCFSGFGVAGENEEDKKFVWKQKKLRTFSNEEIKKECQKYEGKFLGYYGKIYIVEKCRRRLFVGKDLVRRLFRSGKINVISVNGDTMIKLKAGEDYYHLPSAHVKVRSCKDLEYQYVILGGSEIYYIEKCLKRLMPDYETYQAHMKKHKKSSILVEVSPSEFKGIPLGKPVPSIMPEVYLRLMNNWADADILPLEEACAGVNNRFVTYYSRLYRIEACYKREVIDITGFLKAHQSESRNYTELSSEQWLSLPDGLAWKLKKKKKKKKL